MLRTFEKWSFILLVTHISLPSRAEGGEGCRLIKEWITLRLKFTVSYRRRCKCYEYVFVCFRTIIGGGVRSSYLEESLSTFYVTPFIISLLN